MKKAGVFITGVFFLFLSLGSNGQSKTGADYFAGKWNVLIKGLPSGDTKMIVNLEKKDTTLTGVIQDSTGTEISKFSKVELNDSSVTVYFTAQGYDVNLEMDKKDDDHIIGNMLGMFDAEGERLKETK